MKKITIFLLSCLVLSGILVGIFNYNNAPYLPTFVDPPADTVVIEDEEVPLGNITSKKTTKTSKKKTIKKIKMKTAAKRSYTKKLPTKIETSIKKSNSETSNAEVQTKVTTKITTEQLEKYTKKSKVKEVTSNITKQVTTLVITTEKNNQSQVININDNQDIIKKDILNARTIAPKMDNKIISAFERLGFKISIDSTVSYSGCFNASTQQIILKKENDVCVYHELGHFVAFIANNIDRSTNFNNIFLAEKNLYTAYNKSYVVQNASEYFAESVKDYSLNNNTLKSNRPQTYNAVVSALNMVTDEQITKYQKVYSSIWASN